MENEIVMKFEGIDSHKARQKIMRSIQKLPGIEYVNVSAHGGIVTVMGGDIDRLAIEDDVESMGYPLVR